MSFCFKWPVTGTVGILGNILYGSGNLYKDLLFVYLQPSVKPRHFDFTI